MDVDHRSFRRTESDLANGTPNPRNVSVFRILHIAISFTLRARRRKKPERKQARHKFRFGTESVPIACDLKHGVDLEDPVR